MRVCVAVEERFHRLADGSLWTRTRYDLAFWQRYLAVFDQVRCVARVLDVDRLDGHWHRADGEGVSVSALPHYVGPAQFLKQARRVRLAMHDAIAPGDAFVLRAPGNISDLAWSRLTAMRYPYAIEVIGDPYDLFSPGAIRHPLRRFLRWHATRQLRSQCAGASAASYVTAEALQRRYPSPAPAIAASSIELRDEAIAAAPRTFANHAAPVPLIFVGSLEQYYKAPDLLMRSVARCVARGLDLHLTIVGDGRFREDLEALAVSLSCQDRVRFTGQVPVLQVAGELDRASLFILPSRTEGLPRAMVEAMARGLPCIGTTAGGIPELLPPDALVPPGDEGALADKIAEVLGDPARMTRMSAWNLEKAKAYRSAVLQERRISFHKQIRRATETWLRAHTNN